DADISDISGYETNASVDSELSMVMFDDYPLYRWQENELENSLFPELAKTLMASRLDGPGEEIARGLIDKAVKAQREGLKGRAYIDKGYSLLKTKPLYKVYDDHLGRAAEVIAGRGFEVITDDTKNVFGEGKCPRAALYCGWYSLRRYVDAFDFVDGAVGYHIASLEAVDLRDGQSTQWVPSMLADGITVTIGAVAEPYLSAFPKPDCFFAELFKGKTVVEAYYRCSPFNSWQMMLIGDPLYRPFVPAGQIRRKM
ncbi:MAG: TIGR03790 family protein, partial [Sedimentisphaerales bacterium]|nr:TIGR03790 family protein [Sedimentisphaerales bacterium]